MNIENHRHCQATVLGATGIPTGAGLTWNEINGLDLQHIASVNHNWKSNFTSNSNITQDLAGILKLIDNVAENIGTGGVGDARWTLKFSTNNGDEIKTETIDADNSGEIVDISGFGRDIKLTIGDKDIKFNTMKEGTYRESG